MVLVQAHVGEPFDGRKAVAHGDRVGLRLELLAHEPHDVHRAAEAARVVLGGLGCGRGLREHVVARTAPRLDEAARHQQLEGGHHGVLGVAVKLREFAQRGQLVAGLVGAARDLAREGVGERIGDRGHGLGL
ncbi:hypothetical protein D9M68_643550 [compost metagenome]